MRSLRRGARHASFLSRNLRSSRAASLRQPPWARSHESVGQALGANHQPLGKPQVLRSETARSLGTSRSI
jgi:hypothetical protein